VSCVEDYMLFASELVNGERLLKRENIDLMRSEHISGAAYKDFQELRPGYSYGLGVRTNMTNKFSAIGEFGWDGAAGAYVMLDPDNHIAVFYVTHIRGYGHARYMGRVVTAGVLQVYDKVKYVDVESIRYKQRTIRVSANVPYEEGGYEAGSSNFRVGVAELIMEEGKKLMDEMQ